MPKQATPNYSVFYKKKYMKGQTKEQTWLISGANVPLGWQIKRNVNQKWLTPQHTKTALSF
jgi:hypothetical protein